MFIISSLIVEKLPIPVLQDLLKSSNSGKGWLIKNLGIPC